MKVHGFHLSEAFTIVPWEAPQPERFAGGEELVEEVVEIGDTPTETERDRRSEGARATFGKLNPAQSAALGSFDKATIPIHHASDDGLMETEITTAGHEATVVADELRDRTEMLIDHVDATWLCGTSVWNLSPMALRT